MALETETRAENLPSKGNVLTSPAQTQCSDKEKNAGCLPDNDIYNLCNILHNMF